ncbi:hypothetical protein [Algoriphagus sp.]|uniref:hypothetical protein n=1 Tax=Algoriphagus sp. TaxID=1872435 RepID=UPI0025E6DE08|nr:hypothetical protein [Algoriphagus sp.]
MTLKEAINYFESLNSATSQKSKRAIFQKFIHLLKNLENKDLSTLELKVVEQTLDGLGLEAEGPKNNKYFKKALGHFQKKMKELLSLTPEGYYTNLGVGLGASFGVLFGIVVLSSFERSMGISFGISIGMLIGILVGRNLDAQAKASGKMI